MGSEFGSSGPLFDGGYGASQTFLPPIFGQKDAQGVYPSTPGTPGGNVHSDPRSAPGSAGYDGFSTESPALQKYFRERAVRREGTPGSASRRPAPHAGASGSGPHSVVPAFGGMSGRRDNRGDSALAVRGGEVSDESSDDDDDDGFLPPRRSMYDEDLVGGRVSPPPGPGAEGWEGARMRQFGVPAAAEGPTDAAHAAPSPARPEGLDHSVVVYGFARHQVGDTLRRLRELGTVVHSAVPAHGNYMLVQFETGVSTANALALSGRRVTLGGEPTMLGVRRFSLEADGDEFLQAAPSGLGAPTPQSRRREPHQSTLVHEDIFLPREQGGMCERLMRMLFSW